MKCPNCDHVADALPFKCAMCGESYDADSWAKLQQLEFVSCWLTDHATQIGDTLALELRGELQAQVDGLRDSVSVSRHAAPLARVQAGTQQGPSKEIAQELALIEATLGALPQWAAKSEMSVKLTTELRQYLSGLSEDLRQQRLPQDVEIAKPSERVMLNFVLQSLPLWGEYLQPTGDDLEHLRDHLQNRRIISSLPEDSNQIAMGRSRSEAAYELAVVQAALPQILDAARATHIRVTSWTFLQKDLSEWLAELTNELAGQSITVMTVSTWAVLDLLLQLLELWIKGTEMPASDVWILREYIRQRRAALMGTAQPQVIPETVSAEQAAVREMVLAKAMLDLVSNWAVTEKIAPDVARRLQHYISLRIRQLRPLARKSGVTHARPSDAEVREFTIMSLPLFEQMVKIPHAEIESLRAFATQPQRAASAPAPTPIAKVVRPSKPAAPPIDWSKAWEQMWNFVVSGALLRGLLYLGAFMIVVSTAVLVFVYWQAFHPVLQLSLIAAVPIAFYLSGFILRNRLAIPVAGGVFTSVGSLLVAIDFAAVYQLGGLAGRVDVNLYWLIASVISSVIYSVIANRIREEFHGYIWLLGLSSTLVAATRVLHLPLEWSLAAVSGFAAGMVASGAALRRVSEPWQEIVGTFHRLPVILLPLSQVALLFVPGDSAAGKTVGFTCAALGYGLLAWYFPKAFWAHAAVWSSAAAGFFLAVHLPFSWLAALTSGGALAYLMAGRGLERFTASPDTPRRALRIALILAGFVCLLIAFLASIFTLLMDFWAGVAGLTSITLVLASCAILFRRANFVLLAASVFGVVFSLSLARVLLDARIANWEAWVMAGWGVLALAYLGGAVALRRAEPYAQRLNVCAHVLGPLAVATLLANFSIFPAQRWAAAPSLGALTAVLLVYLVSALIHARGHDPALSKLVQGLPQPVERSAFLWPSMAVLFVWLYVFWLAIGLPLTWLATGYAALAFLYMLAGEWLKRRQPAYRVALASGAFVAWLLTLLISGDSIVMTLLGRGGDPNAALITATTSAVALTIVAARVYRTRLPLFVEPWLALLPASLICLAYGAQIFGRALTIPQFAWVWLALSIAHGLAAFLLDRTTTRYAHGLYLGSYGLAGLALIWSAAEPVLNLYLLGALIILAVVSQVTVHIGRHRSFADLLNWFWRDTTSPDYRLARMLFLFVATFALPVWLFQYLAQLSLPLPARGLALTLTAPVYIALGLALRRIKDEYRLPLYSAAYPLTAIGVWLSLGNEQQLIYALAIDTLVFAASAYLFRRAAWLYLANALLPLLTVLVLQINQWLNAQTISGSFIALAFLYFAAGQWLTRRHVSLTSFAHPFYRVGYLLSFVALSSVGSDRYLALAIYSAAIVLYGLSARAFRQIVFLYLAVWLSSVPYSIALTLLPLPASWLGLGWLPFIALAMMLGKFASPPRLLPKGASYLAGIRSWLANPSLPFYLFAYALSLYMIVRSADSTLAMSLAALAAASLYFVSATIFQRAIWLYPALLALHFSLLKFLSALSTDLPLHYVTLPFLVLTYAIALSGYLVSRRSAAERAMSTSTSGLASLQRSHLLDALVIPRWSQPFFIVSVLDVVLWQSVALGNPDTAAIVSAGHALLLALFTLLWQAKPLAYGSLIFFVLAVYYQLIRVGLAPEDALATLGGVGLAMHLFARLTASVVQKTAQNRLAIWSQPLTTTAIGLSILLLVSTLVTVFKLSIATSATLAFVGTLYLAVGYEWRRTRLSYLGLALLELAWVLALLTRGVAQPQFYAVPAGLYFAGVGWLERRRGRQSQNAVQHRLAALIESFGLGVMLLTSFMQSLGADGFPYFLLLMVEALAVIWWGATWHIKIPFFIGVAASAINVLAQVVIIISVYDINRFIVIFGAGILLVTLAVLVERQRVRIIATTQHWRELLEAWE